MTNKIISLMFTVVVLLLMAACGGEGTNEPDPTATLQPIDPPTQVPTDTPVPPPTNTPVPPPTNTPVPPPTNTPVPPTAAPILVPTNTPLVIQSGGSSSVVQSSSGTGSNNRVTVVETVVVATPTNTPIPVPTEPPPPTSEPLFYNLPATELTVATGLYASPNRPDLIMPVTIPEGETVYVMGRNKTQTHLRIVWNTGVGWVPVGFTDCIGDRSCMDALPIFEREPPTCAEPLTTQFGLNSTWESTLKQRVAVIIDLFRSKFGEFPQSSMALVVNGVEVTTSKRMIVENGQFSLKDIVFSIPQDLQPGDTLGYALETASNEPLTFMATIFSVPRNCKWKLD
ncbi:MAG: hypothetical protein AAF639_45285 [Chloroflexota bacterium]